MSQNAKDNELIEMFTCAYIIRKCMLWKARIRGLTRGKFFTVAFEMGKVIVDPVLEWNKLSSKLIGKSVYGSY